MNRSNTLDSEVLQAAGQADKLRRRQLVVKLATNANAGGANITTTNVNSKTIIQQLDNFAKGTAGSILADLSIPTWNQQTYLDMLGDDLGPRILEVLDQQKGNTANKSTPSITAPPSPPAGPGADPPLHEVEVPSADTVAGQEEFLAQMANNEDASTVQQPELDPLVILIQSKLNAGEDIKELLKHMQEQAGQRRLATAAFKKPINRKDTSAWAFPAGNEAGKRRISSLPRHDPTPSIPGLGATMVAPPAAHRQRDRFGTAPRALTHAGASTQLLPTVETEWMAMNASIYLLTSNQAERLTVTTASAFLTAEFLRAKTAPIMAFREEIQFLMKDEPSWSQCSHLYQAVRANKPFINASIVNLFVNNIWATTSFASSQCALDAATSLFLCCPADRRSAVFQVKEDEVIKADMAAHLGTNKGKAAEGVPLLARCTYLLDVVSALLFMSAAARICCDEVEDTAPALPWLLDFAASTIFMEEIEDTFVAQAPREELLSHYLLHELQEIFRVYVKGVTHFRQKSMVTHNGCVKLSNWTAAARAIMELPRKIEMLANADLNATGLVTLRSKNNQQASPR